MSDGASKPRRFVTAAEHRYMKRCAKRRRELSNKAIARRLGLSEHTVANELRVGRRRAWRARG